MLQKPVSRESRAWHRPVPGWLLLLLSASALGCGEPAGPPPNILLYVVDTLRADALGHYGHPDANTPNFDRFASEGVVFEQAFANASWTRASMTTLLTGLLPWNHRTEGRDDLLESNVITLSDRLRETGYATALITANPNVGSLFGYASAFDHVSDLYARTRPGRVRDHELITPSDEVSDEALAWLAHAPEPFLLVVLAIDPHAPYTPPRHFDPRRVRDARGVSGLRRTIDRDDLSDAQKARVRELYQAEVSFNDESFGRLVDGLKRRRIYDHTLTVLTSDHGEEFWEYDRRGHGGSLSEEVLHIPLVIRYPGSRELPAGGRIRQSIQLIDVVPTLLDLIGLPLPPNLDGRPFFDDPNREEEVVFSSVALDEHLLRAIRAGRWKLVWAPGSDQYELYDLESPDREGTPIAPPYSPEESSVKRRLAAALRSALPREVPLERAALGDSPKGVEESLRGLDPLDPIDPPE
jgi:arylsulfatase A-like enzyme